MTKDPFSGLQDFHQWMLEQGMAAPSCQSYCYNVLGAQRYKDDHRIGTRMILHTSDPQEVQAAIDELLNDDGFVQFNKEQHYRFLAAIKKYQLYLSEKPAEPVDQDEAPAQWLERTTSLIAERYKNGFHFNENAIRLLSESLGFAITENMRAKLKALMVRRSDDTWLLLDQIAPAPVRDEIVQHAVRALEENRFFEAEMLFEEQRNRLLPGAIEDIQDFVALLSVLLGRDAGCIGTAGRHVIRMAGSTKEELFNSLADRIMALIRTDYAGVISEDDLTASIAYVSPELIQFVVKHYLEDLIRTEINSTICYQTLDALGVPEEFPELLAQTLDDLRSLGLKPTEENLHTVLSIRLGINIRREYGLPDDKTFRRLIALYDASGTGRRWKAGLYLEDER